MKKKRSERTETIYCSIRFMIDCNKIVSKMNDSLHSQVKFFRERTGTDCKCQTKIGKM